MALDEGIGRIERALGNGVDRRQMLPDIRRRILKHMPHAIGKNSRREDQRAGDEDVTDFPGPLDPRGSFQGVALPQ